MLVLVPDVSEKPLEFIKDYDGWYINKENKLAINPLLDLCMADPWYADHVCPAPKLDFEVLEAPIV